ncbi:MAG: AMP-binding enzyme [Promethearchaeota archaeon]
MGDLGYIDENGGLWIKGHKKFIIRVGSYTVLPTEIEEVVLEHPDVAMAAAIGIPDKIYGEVIWLYVVPENGKTLDEKELLELCKEKLADFKISRKIIFKKSLPITRLGKIDRVTLRK